MLACDLATPGLKGVGVIPAIRVKRILYQGGAQQKGDLLFGHANPQAVDDRGFECVALANINAVGGTAVTYNEADQSKNCNENFSHFEL